MVFGWPLLIFTTPIRSVTGPTVAAGARATKYGAATSRSATMRAMGNLTRFILLSPPFTSGCGRSAYNQTIYCPWLAASRVRHPPGHSSPDGRTRRRGVAAAARAPGRPDRPGEPLEPQRRRIVGLQGKRRRLRGEAFPVVLDERFGPGGEGRRTGHEGGVGLH